MINGSIHRIHALRAARSHGGMKAARYRDSEVACARIVFGQKQIHPSVRLEHLRNDYFWSQIFVAFLSLNATFFPSPPRLISAAFSNSRNVSSNGNNCMPLGFARPGDSPFSLLVVVQIFQCAGPMAFKSVCYFILSEHVRRSHPQNKKYRTFMFARPSHENILATSDPDSPAH